ncbi:unnamed protein product [Schistosoma margrebowiei]|uniref:Uncharacterized protein n=1 Tax=Schistosoma margrebowiei TaxID=48269 RepID=A0A183N0K8_9TREM|nr:unnamed protein product [Schistosoma margrebowiei]
MVVGGSRQETLDLGFVLLGTRQQDVPKLHIMQLSDYVGQWKWNSNHSDKPSTTPSVSLFIHDDNDDDNAHKTYTTVLHCSSHCQSTDSHKNIQYSSMMETLSSCQCTFSFRYYLLIPKLETSFCKFTTSEQDYAIFRVRHRIVPEQFAIT